MNQRLFITRGDLLAELQSRRALRYNTPNVKQGTPLRAYNCLSYCNCFKVSEIAVEKMNKLNDLS